MKIKFISLCILVFVSAAFLLLLLSHRTFSSLYPCNACEWIDAHIMPTPAGYLKVSNGRWIFFQKIPDQPWIEVAFPFSCDHPVQCSQSNSSAFGRTHFYTNTLYAIDLASLSGQPAGHIYAAFGGKALVQDCCPHASGVTTENSNVCDCGFGFGNNVRIVQPDGTWALYAHLSSILVKNGEMVQTGQLLGIEGATGKAGERHLHFSVHKTFGEHPEDLEMYQTPGLSIPFMWMVRLVDEKVYKLRSSMEIKVGDILCGQACYE